MTYTDTRKTRIRHCSGNRDAWLLVKLNRDGTESDSFGSYTTAMSLDALLRNAGHLAPRPGETIELIVA